MPVPLKQKALVIPAPLAAVTIETADVPKPGRGEILVKVQAASLNPIDWRIQTVSRDVINNYPVIFGIDPAGDVVESGDGVTEFSVGDKVFFQGILENRRAAYQEYTIAKAKVVARIPSSWKEGYDEVATFPCAGGAAYLALFEKEPYGLGIPNPLRNPANKREQHDKAIFILGGCSSVGQFAIQFAKYASFSTILTTSSLKHESHLKSLGATHVINRHRDGKEIQEELHGIMGQRPLKYVFDAVSHPETQSFGYDMLSAGGCMVIVSRDDKRGSKTKDKRVSMASVMRENPEDREDVKCLYDNLTRLFEDGTIKAPRLEVLPKGLASVAEGLKRLENAQVSGMKLVVHPPKTPQA